MTTRWSRIVGAVVVGAAGLVLPTLPAHAVDVTLAPIPTVGTPTGGGTGGGGGGSGGNISQCDDVLAVYVSYDAAIAQIKKDMGVAGRTPEQLANLKVLLTQAEECKEMAAKPKDTTKPPATTDDKAGGGAKTPATAKKPTPTVATKKTTVKPTLKTVTTKPSSGIQGSPGAPTTAATTKKPAPTTPAAKATTTKKCRTFTAIKDRKTTVKCQ